MFVRVKYRQLVDRHRGNRRSLCIQVVVSYRKNDKPRQKVIAHLGAVQEHDIQYRDQELYHRWMLEGFWDRATAKLDSLRLPPDTRCRLEVVLAETVPRPDTTIP